MVVGDEGLFVAFAKRPRRCETDEAGETKLLGAVERIRARLDAMQGRWNGRVANGSEDKEGEALIVEHEALHADLLLICATAEAAVAAGKAVGAAIAGAAAADGLRRVARDRLTLLLLQAGRTARARELLLAGGYRYRLSDAVLRAPATSATVSAPALSLGDNEQQQFVGFVDDAMPEALFRDLQEFFSPDAKFWEEHLYFADDGFFSYEVPLALAAGEASEAGRAGVRASRHPAVEAAMLIAAIAAAAAPRLCGEHGTEPGYAEWWCHTKPHCAGHLLHFDQSDDAKVPIVSTVLYISSEDVGGPTVVTAQAMDDNHLAARGWRCPAKANRLLLFDGRLLHGVAPAAGCAPQLQEPLGLSASAATGAFGALSTAAPARRCTLMVALCRDRTARGERHGLPMPDGSAKNASWVDARASSAISPLDRQQRAAVLGPTLRRPEPVPVWVDVDIAANALAGRALAGRLRTQLPAPSECFQGITPWRAVPDRLLAGDAFE